MKKGLGDKGFTLIELLIVVAILGILAAILVPSYTQYIISTKGKICEINRLEFVHSFKVYKAYDGGSHTLADAVEGHMPALEAERLALRCPSGGKITATATYIDCDKHGRLYLDGHNDAGGGGNGDGGTTEPPAIPNVQTTGSWSEYFTYAANNYSITVKRGQVLQYGDNYYTFRNDTNINVADGGNYEKTPDEYAKINSGVIKLDFTKVHTEYGVGSNGQLLWNPPLTKGALFIDEVNNKTYVCIDNIGATTWENGKPSPSSGGSVWNLLDTNTGKPQK